MYNTGLKVSSIQLFATILWHFPWWTGSTLVLFHTVNGRRISNKTSKPLMNLQLKPYRSTHHSQQHLSSPPSYRKYNTIFYKRTKRSEHLLSYKEQRTGRVCTANMDPPSQGPVNIWTKWVSEQYETEHFGCRTEPRSALNVKWIRIILQLLKMLLLIFFTSSKSLSFMI